MRPAHDFFIILQKILDLSISLGISNFGNGEITLESRQLAKIHQFTDGNIWIYWRNSTVLMPIIIGTHPVARDTVNENHIYHR